MAIHPDHPRIDQRKLAVANCCSRLLPIVGLALLFLGIFGKNPPINMGKTWSIITISTGSIFTVVFSCLGGCFCLAMREMRRQEDARREDALNDGDDYGVYGQDDDAMLRRAMDVSADYRQPHGDDDAELRRGLAESHAHSQPSQEIDPAIIRGGVDCLKEFYYTFRFSKEESDQILAKQFLDADPEFNFSKLLILIVQRYMPGKDKAIEEIPLFFKPPTIQQIRKLRKVAKGMTKEEDLNKALSHATSGELSGILLTQCLQIAIKEIEAEQPVSQEPPASIV